MQPTIHGVDERLRRRYQQLVQEHTGHAHPTAAGPRHLAAASKAAAQAAWRFYHNPRLTFPTLAAPLLEAARRACAADCDRYGLVLHDWSPLDYRRHAAKRDRTGLVHPGQVGYDLLASVLVSDRDGAPLAPLGLRLRAAGGVFCSRSATRRRPAPHLDQLGPVMRFIGARGLPKEVVHLIDREADSVLHYRRWDRAGHRFVVRADDDRMVRYGGADCSLPAVVEALRRAGAFRPSGAVTYQHRPAQQFVAEAAVVLERPAWPRRVVRGKHRRRKVQGRPLPLRLVVSEVRDGAGNVLALWLLLTNVPAEVSAATVALWYYWRWQVESYFKLLKGAGQEVERWQQATAAALLRRLLVASMACVLVWRLARSTAPQAGEARALLVRLSGRQLAWGKSFTEEALLAGLWVLLAMLETLQQYAPEQLRALADFILSGSREPAADSS